MKIIEEWKSLYHLCVLMQLQPGLCTAQLTLMNGAKLRHLKVEEWILHQRALCHPITLWVSGYTTVKCSVV